MVINIDDQAIKTIGENIMYLVKEYRNAPSTGSKSSDIKDIVDEMNNEIKEARKGKIRLSAYYSGMIGVIGHTLFALGGHELFDKVLEYLENHPDDPEVQASERLARAMEEVRWESYSK